MPLEVGYWSIRGLAAPLRMICEYVEVEYNSVTYELGVKEDGGWDASAWFSVKPALKEKNALMNLPYIVDGDVVVSQSNACLTYLGRKFNLNGKNDDELIKNEQCLCELMDLRNNAVKLFYSPKDVFEKDVGGFLTGSVKTSYGKLNLWLEQNGTTFLASTDKPTVCDFHFFELINQIEELAKTKNAPSPMAEFSAVESFYKNFEKLPAVAKYLESSLHKLPINNKMASFGAVGK